MKKFVANEEMDKILTARSALADALGVQFGGLRDLYQTFGWKKDLGFVDYYSMYIRNAVAKAVIKRPANDTWAGDFEIVETDDGKDTEFEKACKDLQKQLKLKTVFNRLDRITSLGNYGILLFGLSDCRTTADFAKPVRTGNGLRLLYLKPVTQQNAKISKYDTNPNSPRYGLPLIYSISLKSVNSTSGSTFQSVLNVHYSRVLHVSWDLLEDEVEGTPVLQSIYNNLMDIEKLAGGSAEMFWRGANPGLFGQVDPEFTMSSTDEQNLKEQVEAYVHQLRKFLISQGVEIKELTPAVADPTNHIKIQIALISAVTGIPQRILLGAEQGELASGQDANAWKVLIQNRRTEQAEQLIVRPFFDRLIEYQIVPTPSTVYSVLWSDVFAPSEKERAETGKIRAAAIQQYLQNPIAVEIIPPEIFYKFLLGLDKQQLDYVTTVVAENKGTAQEEALMERLKELEATSGRNEQNSDGQTEEE